MAPQKPKRDSPITEAMTLAIETFYDANGGIAGTSVVAVSIGDSKTYGAPIVPNPQFTVVSVTLQPFTATWTAGFSTASSTSASPSPSSSITSITASTTASSTSSSAASSPPFSSSPTSSTNSSSHQPTLIPAAKAAGIGIGTAVIGALIALLAVWILSRRKRSREGVAEKYSWTKVKTNGDDEKRIGNQNEITFEKNLLERADDSTIRKSVQDLNEMIDQHCVNYYHLQNLNINHGDLEHRLVECGYNSPSTSGPSVAELVRLLQNPKTRIAAIHRLISQLVLSHADWRSKPEVSLLPSHITHFWQAIPPIEIHPESKEVFEKSFTKWRQLSAFLLQPIRSNREALKANKRELQGAINRNIASLNNVLSSFVEPDLDNQRLRQDNLGEIIFEGAQIGLLLFSQPFEWQYSWQPTSSRTELTSDDKARIRATITEIRGQGTKNARPLVVFPAIVESIESNGVKRVRVIAHCVEVEV